MARNRLMWRPATAIAAVLAIAALSAKPVLAHSRLTSASPAPGARLQTAPRELRLTFSEALEPAYTAVQLLDASYRRLPLAAPRSAGANTIAIPLPEPLRAGPYTVVWRTTGVDGHPTHGKYGFVVLASRAGTDRSRPATGPEAGAEVTPPGVRPAAHEHHMDGGEGAFDASSPAYVVIRFLLYAALVVLIGAVSFRMLVLGSPGREAPAVLAGVEGPAAAAAARIGAAAAAAVLVIAFGRLFAQSVALHGAAEALLPARLAMMLGRTLWGWAWILQVAAAGAALGGFLTAGRGRETGWVVAALSSGALALSVALSGHAAAADVSGIGVLADAGHVVGAAGWLGSLFTLLVAGVSRARQAPRERRGAAVVELVNAFSPTALTFAAVTAGTGVFAAWIHLGGIPALWQTTYGRVLLLKLGLLAGVAASGAYNWLAVRPTLGRDEAATQLRRSATLELALGAAVLLVTAILVALPTPASG